MCVVLITMCGITLRCLFISMYIFSPLVTGVCGASGEVVVYVVTSENELGVHRSHTSSQVVSYELTAVPDHFHRS